MNGVAAAHKTYHAPGPLHRPGCPCVMTPYYQVSTLPEGERVELVHKYTTMQLTHYSKTAEIKNSLHLGDLHHELELSALALQGSGASNIVLSKVSFDCLLRDEEGGEERAYLSFDLRIPGANSTGEAVFSYDMIERAYGSKANLYAALKHFYEAGRARANPNNYVHGHRPDYNPLSSKHDQYIRHTEQLLVAYLALPEAGEMLKNRLRAEIRSKYPDVISVKAYNMGVHIQSTKTCCAPCEYSLIGLMNERVGLMQNGKRLGFLPNFMEAARAPNEQLEFHLPVRSLFRLLVTVCVGEHDAHHKTQPPYTAAPLGPRDPVPPFLLNTKGLQISNYIITTMLSATYDRRRLPALSNISDQTVGISGSRASSGSPGTINKVRTLREGEVDELGKRLDTLKV